MNEIIEDEETLIEIIKKLKDKYKIFYIYDCEDASKIIIDEDAIILLRRQYENKLYNLKKLKLNK